MQIVLALWSIFSVSIGVLQFQPGSDSESTAACDRLQGTDECHSLACKDSPCGWGIVVCLICFYFLAHMWISAVSYILK